MIVQCSSDRLFLRLILIQKSRNPKFLNPISLWERINFAKKYSESSLNEEMTFCNVSRFQDVDTIPWVLVVVTVVDVGANDKPLCVVFTVAYCWQCCCAPPLFDLSDSIVIYALFVFKKNWLIILNWNDGISFKLNQNWNIN